MPAAIPTLGYPSKSAAIAALFAEGRSVPEVADLTDTPKKIVRTIASTRGLKYPRERLESGRAVHLPQELRAKLMRQARTRNIGVRTLALRLLDTIVTYDLVDAVLDDKTAKDRE